jgi:prepilin-type N-terminal cleavage/methylation domain-containing protein
VASRATSSTSRGRGASRAARRRGFTLLEVVFAMAILALGMTAVLGLLSFGAALARTAALRTSAAEAVDAVVADLEERLFPLDPATGRAGAPAPVSERAVPGHPELVYSARATREPGAPAGGVARYRVDVDLAWQAAGARRAKRFTLLMLGEVPFGERLRRALGADDREREGNPASRLD